MKNTKITYLLIGIVILIWGIIVFRLVSTVTDDHTTKTKYSNNIARKEKEINENYKLKLNYRDPFLGKSYKKELPKRKIIKKPIITVPTINLDGIQLKGVIRNNKHKIAIVNFNGQEQLIKEGDTYNNIRFVKYYNDSIVLMVGKTRSVLKK